MNKIKMAVIAVSLIALLCACSRYKITQKFEFQYNRTVEIKTYLWYDDNFLAAGSGDIIYSSYQTVDTSVFCEKLKSEYIKAKRIIDIAENITTCD